MKWFLIRRSCQACGLNPRINTSIRVEAARMGADVATCPFKVLQQMLKHPLTDSGLEQFLADWEKAKK